MKILRFLKSLVTGTDIEYLNKDFCKGKPNSVLLNKLQSGSLSKNSGNMIVLELLERINTKVENGLGPHIHKNENHEQKF